MQKKDLLRICLQNLMRRRSRTFLTVLGVLIGCCSIVIMVSLGIGMKETQEKLLAEMGDLTIITVSPPQNGKGKVKLDDALVKRLHNMSGVVGVSPKQSLEAESIRILSGTGNRYVADWTSVVGMDTDQMEQLGYRIINGTTVKHSGDIIIGEFLAYSFKDTLRPEGRNMIDRWAGELDENGKPAELPAPYLDPLKSTLTLEITTESGPIKYPV